MEAMEKRVALTSVSAFFTKLAAEPEIGRRANLSRLLLEEVDKHEGDAEYLKGIDAYIAKCNAQIAKHEALLDCGANQDLVQNVLNNITAFKAKLQSARKFSSH